MKPASASAERQDEKQHNIEISETANPRNTPDEHGPNPEPLRVLNFANDDEPSPSTPGIFVLKLPNLSPESTERIFPISSVVSVDSSAPPTPAVENPEEQNPPWAESLRSNFTGGKQSPGQPATPSPDDRKDAPSIQSTVEAYGSSLNVTTGSRKRTPLKIDLARGISDISLFEDVNVSSQGGSGLPSSAEAQDSYFAGAGSWIDQAETATWVQDMEDEPNFKHIHGLGALIVLQESKGSLIVQVASKNTEEVLGYKPEQLFALPSFCDIVQDDQKKDFLGRFNLVRGKWYNVEQHGPDIHEVDVRQSYGTTRRLWCTMHATKANSGHIVCEFELMRAVLEYWKNSGPSKSVYAVYDNTSSDERSDEKNSTPSMPPEMQNMLRGIRGNFRSADMLSALSLVIQLAASTSSLSMLFNYFIGIIRELTGFSRVTVFYFDRDGNAVPMNDAVDSRVIASFPEDLHFPKPLSPRDLERFHLDNKVCLEYSHRRSHTELVYRDSENLPSEFDLDHSYMLARSPYLVDHVTGMPVFACMSININAFGRAWGLIMCQSYEEEMRLPPPVQKFFWLVSDTLSSNIERLSNTMTAQMQDPFTSSNDGDEKGDSFQVKDLLTLFKADYAASLMLGETKILGKPHDAQEVLALVEYLKLKELGAVLCSTDMTRDFPDLNYTPGFKYLSNLLYVPLSTDGREFIVFFKASQRGDTFRAGTDDNARCLDQGQPTDLSSEAKLVDRETDIWNAGDLQKGPFLSLIYRAMLKEVWQQKETTMQSTQLMRLLLANCAHEFRTPLNAIINYLEIALDGDLTQETRESLSRSHSASKSLIYIINDLLDLTNAENGISLIKDENFDLVETIHEASRIFCEEARQKGVELHVVQYADIPPVLGDQRRVRQVITNLISNAVQHTSSSGTVTVESCLLPDYTETGKLGIEVAIHDTGTGMSQNDIEALFCELEQVSNKDYIRSRRPQRCDNAKTSDSSGSRNILGLGLALVARIVRNMNGQLSVKSEEGQGSCFRIKMQFPLPFDESNEENLESNRASPVDKGKARQSEPEDGQNVPPKQDETQCSEDDRAGAGKNTGSSKCADSTKHDSHTSDDTVTANFAQHDSASKQEESTIHPDIRTKPPSTEEDGQAHQPHLRSAEQSTRALADEPTKPIEEAASGSSERTAEPSQTEAKSQSDIPPNEGATTASEGSSKKHLHILVAEDDPTNSTILRKRLEKSRHTVHMTENGKECASAFRDNAHSFDAVLMDIQMPIVDGMGSTKMIREYEELTSPTSFPATYRPQRIPIFAVSASLMEKDRQTYIDAGFDGWIMKPIDFKRVAHLLDGVYKEDAREDSLYKSGMWEKGGWFDKGGES
ncbi:putative sensor histidine kinase/response regulator [Aspergillus fischeri NRRL 181]|uniref:histidine kinase n=1 Tax=Neosartorya fischeri (strain ATCC 1020 / DSM 3700 / CBS 544.65 / FGSC A1164 / JCM 1740 / NRRL 181 / WB 181) TaxID=331117 RepID=A1DMX5_NEOFI|nr:sensor histidine kinase/response regulator, putative [Aspergillus fischeri NRRL 181]EAW16146.1 sensor histidine kinase/response regulator, putative [Aspergillus fischeri NRRL 181]